MNVKVMAQMSRYVIVGASAALIEVAIYVSLTYEFPFWKRYYLIANAIAFIVSNVFGFIFHKLWTFRNKESRILHQYVKYFVTSGSTLILSEVLLYVFVSVFIAGHGVGKVIVTAITAAINFSINNIWTFKNNKQDSPVI